MPVPRRSQGNRQVLLALHDVVGFDLFDMVSPGKTLLKENFLVPHISLSAREETLLCNLTPMFACNLYCASDSKFY